MFRRVYVDYQDKFRRDVTVDFGSRRKALGSGQIEVAWPKLPEAAALAAHTFGHPGDVRGRPHGTESVGRLSG